MTALIFDTETTGHKEDPGLIEAAGIVMGHPVDIDLRASASFENRYNPGKPSTLGALATHHILDSELTECASADTFTLPEGTIYLIGHNVDYDWGVIGKPDVKLICTLAIARYAWPQLDSHKLGALAYHVMGDDARERLREAHSGASDCETTRWLLRHLISAVRRAEPQNELSTWEHLWRLSEHARIPTHMPFGKHKGEAIAALPKDYIEWLLKDMRKEGNSPDPYLHRALSKRFME